MGEHISTLREERGYTREQLAERAGWSGKSLVGHLEAAVRQFNPDHVAALLPALGRAEHVARYQKLVTDAAGKGEWWRGLLPRDKAERRKLRELELFLSYESSATRIRLYEPYAVPDLLQTPAYAEHVLRVTRPPHAELRRALLPGRQALLCGAEPTELHVVLDETAVRRRVGGKPVLRAQLRHLAARAAQGNVTVRVLPPAAGLPSAEGNFSVLDMPAELDGHPGVAYVRTPRGWVCHERADEVADFGARWERIAAQALPAERSAELITGWAGEPQGDAR
ncbi:helix-turn-helix protein [Prauserella shujinwangii]|uniref:Helix-turn-helix protein n=2 Tax=Prauserella shujinwangii TaxID=1453103 RepID=A0A2T0LSA7_9PSEU|nr:helix-turn-helix protein [Prauserella shujinwangii]